MIARVPPPDVPVPPTVVALARGADIRPVWRNELGGLTFEITSETSRLFVKWAPADSGLRLSAEIARLRWAAAFVPVPRVLDTGSDATGEWLVTAALPGESAVSPRWLADPRTAVAAIGRGLRRLHDTLPVADCPFSWQADDRLQRVLRRVHDPQQWHQEHSPLPIQQALDRVTHPPSIDRLVVCHGDACAPNTLIDESGNCSGQVDLGRLGVADRWADLAIATWSLDWNYGPGWQELLLDSYGVSLDAERTSYYRLLWDLSP